MISRLRQGRGSNWTPLLESKAQLRGMRVMVDHDALAVHAANYGKSRLGLLAGLLHHESISAWSYSDLGPPREAARELSPFGVEVPSGWILAVPTGARAEEPGHGISHVLYWREDESWRSSTIYHGELDRGARASEAVMAATASTSDVAVDYMSDAIAAFCAQGIDADLFITNRRSLLGLDRAATDAVTFATPEQALPIVSLYLRSQGVFLITKASNRSPGYSSSVNRGLFYWVGARELLPEAWRWYDACVRHDQSIGSDELIHLGASALRRVARVLQCRDDLLRTLNKPPTNDDADDLVAALESCLLFLMGAVDATARVAHRVLGIKGRLSSAAWQRPNWVELVSKEAPGLAGLVAPGTHGLDVLTILTLLRNTIHSSSLPPMRSIQMTGSVVARDEIRVRVPRERREILETAISRLGGREYWGLTEGAHNDVHAEPGVLLERVLPAILRLLNDLMAATPVESRLGFAHAVNLADEQEPFDPWTRQSVRWQLGVSDWNEVCR